MSQRPLESLEDLIQQSLDPRALRERFGLPHPLSKFAVNGVVKEGPCADAILEFVNDLTWGAPESAKRKAAAWFLFESARAFFYACSDAGIDAVKLRTHLLKCKSGQLNDKELEGGEERGSA
jgi:hypothetical protein